MSKIWGKKLLFLFATSLLFLMAGTWYVYKNAEKYIHPLLIPPDYYWLDDPKDVYSKTGIVSIAVREFKIPISYVEGRFKKGHMENDLFITYVLPEFKSKLEFPSERKRLQLFNDGYYGSMLLEESAVRSSFDDIVEWRKSNLTKSEIGEDINGLKFEKWYHGKKESPVLYYEVYLEKDKSGKILSFMECASFERPGVITPTCSHRFRDKGILYKINYNKKRYFADWREQRRAAIAFIDSLEIQNQKSAAQESFIDLFLERQKKGDGSGDLRGEATNFVKSNYEKRGDVIEMLLDNGFEFKSKKFGPDEYYDRGFGKEHYDEVIFAKRRTSLRRFWDIFSSYEVTVYIKNEKVDWVSAKVDRTFP